MKEYLNLAIPVLKKHGFKIAFIILGSIIILKKDLSFSINVGTPAEASVVTISGSQIGSVSTKEGEVVEVSHTEKKVPVFFTKQKDVDHAKNYIKRFSKTAVEEMKKYGIPASITMGQGLLETRADQSSLSIKGNNHFGIKYNNNFAGTLIDKDISFSYKKSCNKRGKDCATYFTFSNDWEGFRAHSLFLQRPIYNKVRKCKSNDYVGWAKGLQEAGYAIDQEYSDKLIRIIKQFKLYKLDQL